MTEDQDGWDEGDDERALRALMHRAVDGLQPRHDALPRIRRAVPVRRARYRQAWTGAAVIAVLTAAALPTLHGLGGLQLSDGSAAGAGVTRAPSATGEPTGAHADSDDDFPLPGLTRPAAADSGRPGNGSPAAPSGNAVALPTAVVSGMAGAPDCVRADLGQGSSQVGTPDASGRRYGVFTVVNVSGRACVLADPGTLTVSGGNGQVRVVSHTVGDQALALPDPAVLSGRLLLGPAGSYRLSFAWVPDAPCPAASAGASAGPTGSGGPSPSAGSTATTGPSASSASIGQAGSGARAAADVSAGSTAAASGTAAPVSPQPSASGAGSPPVGGPGTLTVAHQPLGAGPDAATADVPGVCSGGTLYRSVPQPVQ